MAEPTVDPRILVRLSSDLTTKSRRTRSRFQRVLAANLEDALESSGIRARVNHEWGRLTVETDHPAAVGAMARVFGVASLSPVEAVAAPSLDSILEVGARTFAERVRDRTFAVRARRVASFPVSSQEVNVRLGAILAQTARVDLDEPEVTVHIEVTDERAYFFSRKVPGPAGLPIGTEGGAVALISGGFDSAVAAWMMLRRGLDLDYVFCNLGGAAYERNVLAVAKLVADAWSYGSRPNLWVIDFDEPVRNLKDSVPASWLQVVLKRLMYRAAERIADELGANALITGEAVGQVSSQTPANLRAIEDAIVLPVLRPLAGFNKEEIIARSREIGTYALCERVREYCALVERHPVTAASPGRARAMEARLDPAILDRAIAGRRRIDLRALGAVDLVLPYLRVSRVPEGSIVFDTRSPADFAAWHYPGAVHRDFWDLSRDYRGLARDRTYVLYCEIGLRTAQLAEKMQRAGLEAYSFQGGVPGLRSWADQRGVAAAPARR